MKGSHVRETEPSRKELKETEKHKKKNKIKKNKIKKNKIKKNSVPDFERRVVSSFPQDTYFSFIQILGRVFVCLSFPCCSLFCLFMLSLRSFSLLCRRVFKWPPLVTLLFSGACSLSANLVLGPSHFIVLPLGKAGGYKKSAELSEEKRPATTVSSFNFPTTGRPSV